MRCTGCNSFITGWVNGASELVVSWVMVVPGSGHLLDGFDGCVNRIIARFLNGMPVQTDCVESLHPTPFYLGR